MYGIGERLQQIRSATGLSQTAFGNRFGVDKKTQYHYENEHRSPSGKYLRALHDAGLDASYVITGRRDYRKLPADISAIVSMLLPGENIAAAKAALDRVTEGRARS